jgi:predicted negative regulator of RcsB-dependent stress response
VFGWTAWQSRAEATAERVSVDYQSMVEMAASDDHAEALLRADQIIRDQPDSEYAALAGLLGAKSAFAIGRTDDANRLLGWVVENASRAELQDVARIRSVRLLLDQGEPDAALAMLAEVGTSAFATIVAELRGDILIDHRQSEAAAKSYQTALASDSMTSATRARLQMKLDDLGHSDRPGQSQ